MPQRIFIAYSDTIPIKHWALYVEHGEDDLELFEVAGSSGRFQYNTRRCLDPKETSDYIDTVELGLVSSKDLDRLRGNAKRVAISTKDTWHCQHWILALVTKLQEKGITDISDKAWAKLQEDHENYSDDGED